MTDFTDRAAKLPGEDSDFLWVLLVDMAATIDLLMSQTEPAKTEGT